VRRLLATLVAGLVALPLACSRPSSEGPTPIGSAATPLPSATPVAVTGSAAPSASAAAVRELPPLVYHSYTNARFAFTVDVPAFLQASPPPTNGDGLEWTWGGRATMTASGMNASSMTTQDLCGDDAKRKGVTVHTITPTTCWVSGKDAGRIYWERTQLSRGVSYTLVFSYDEHLKEAFDPLVTHVYASWKVPGPPDPPSAPTAAKSKCTPGWIDECGGCYQPCSADRDCKTKGLTCQPIICAHTPYGNGCTTP